jgi:hypothetical protein
VAFDDVFEERWVRVMDVKEVGHVDVVVDDLPAV